MNEKDHIDSEDSRNLDEDENFADLLESYTADMNEDIRVGDKVQGRIVSISDKSVFVNTGTKADGVVDIEELKDDEGRLPYSVGDEIDLYVVAIDESEIRLSKAISGVGGLSMLREAYANGMPVEGKVTQTIKGGFQVEVLKRRAFCPISQMDIRYIEDAEPYVGQTFSFRIKTLAEGGRNIVLSRRELLEAEQKKAREAFLQTLETGQVLSGRVVRLMPYGAFVELIPGVEGMVHISELSWSRVNAPQDALAIGDKIDVKVLNIEAGPKQTKISLSAKQVEGDPWERVSQGLEIGQKITGRVTRLAPFGAFVEVRPGIDGLVHISEMSYTRRVVHPEDIVKPGEEVAVLVKEIDAPRRRLSLSLRDAEGDPWLEVDQKFSTGQRVQGTVQKVENFGLFVELAPGIVGLLPKSVIRQSAEAAKAESLKPGDSVPVVVQTIQPEARKISLGLSDSQGADDWRKFTGRGTEETQSMGTLGEKLAKALKKQ